MALVWHGNIVFTLVSHTDKFGAALKCLMLLSRQRFRHFLNAVVTLVQICKTVFTCGQYAIVL